MKGFYRLLSLLALRTFSLSSIEPLYLSNQSDKLQTDNYFGCMSLRNKGTQDTIDCLVTHSY